MSEMKGLPFFSDMGEIQEKDSEFRPWICAVAADLRHAVGPGTVRRLLLTYALVTLSRPRSLLLQHDGISPLYITIKIPYCRVIDDCSRRLNYNGANSGLTERYYEACRESILWLRMISTFTYDELFINIAMRTILLKMNIL